MIILGIESTAHTLGMSIIKDKKILSNVKKSYVSQNAGMIPAKVADYLESNINNVFSDSLSKANCKAEDIDAIAYSNSPGIGHCLRIGSIFAKSLATQLNIPLIPVNHCIAHLEIARTLGNLEDPLLVYASGANTQLIAYNQGKYRIFGETLDNGIGNFLDGLARHYNLGFPGGPKIEELAKKGKFIGGPYSVKGLDVSFSGLQTHFKNLKGKHPIEDIMFTVQELSFAMLTEITERAVRHLGKKAVALGGGVGCNARLQQMLQDMCKEADISFYAPPKEYLVDNAAMIAVTGEQIYSHANKTKIYEFKDIAKAKIKPYQRTDETEIIYR